MKKMFILLCILPPNKDVVPKLNHDKDDDDGDSGGGDGCRFLADPGFKYRHCQTNHNEHATCKYLEMDSVTIDVYYANNNNHRHRHPSHTTTRPPQSIEGEPCSFGGGRTMVRVPFRFVQFVCCPFIAIHHGHHYECNEIVHPT